MTREFFRERPGRRLRVRCSRRPGATLVSLEANVLGGFQMYGYLAVEYIPAPGGGEGIEVRISDTMDQGGFVPTLVPIGDAVEPGLPDEFVEPVMDALRRSAEFHALPAGHAVNVVSAAHAFAGSNQIIFARIAWCAAAILATPLAELTDAYFDRMLAEMLRPLAEGR